MTVVDATGILRELLKERQGSNVGRFDEIWDGVYHMNPPPSVFHSEGQFPLYAWLAALVADRRLGKVYGEVGVRRRGSGVDDYRVPDLVFVSHERSGLVKHWIEGPPDLVIEVRSPRDGTMKKLPWYIALGVREVLVVDRDTRVPELYRPGRAEKPERVPADARGEVRLSTLPVAVLPGTRPDGLPGLRCYAVDEPARATVI